MKTIDPSRVSAPLLVDYPRGDLCPLPEAARVAVARADDLGNQSDWLVDDIVAPEALVGGDTENGFKIAFRVASMLGPTDDERVACSGVSSRLNEHA